MSPVAKGMAERINDKVAFNIGNRFSDQGPDCFCQTGALDVVIGQSMDFSVISGPCSRSMAR